MRFRVTNIINVLALVILVVVNHFYILSIWYFVLVEIVYLSAVVYGCVHLSMGLFLPVFCKGKTNERVVAITFDDGPHPVHTPRILGTLRKLDVPAAFFCIGKNIVANGPLLKRMTDEGHIIGNHSYSHDFWFDMWAADKMLADMEKMDGEVFKVIGLKPALFRPPYGVMNPSLKKAIMKEGYIPVGWSIRSFDTMIKDEQKLLQKIVGQLQPGSIILLHDLEITANILPGLIAQIRNKGFRIIELDKMLNLPAYA